MTTPQPVPVQTVEDREKERAEFYGQFVAVQQIYIDGALAFNPGDPVGVDHVNNNLVPEGSVAKVTTKAGQKAIAAVTENPKG